MSLTENKILPYDWVDVKEEVTNIREDGKTIGWNREPGSAWQYKVLSRNEKEKYEKDVASKCLPWFKRPGGPLAPKEYQR